jgi:hypothetical protein
MVFDKKPPSTALMEKKLQQLTTSQLTDLLNLERKKFLKALDYNSSPSMLEEIMDTIKIIEKVLAQKENKSKKDNNNQQVA